MLQVADQRRATAGHAVRADPLERCEFVVRRGSASLSCRGPIRIRANPTQRQRTAAIAPVEFRLRGFALTRQPIALPEDTWWARIAVRGGVGYRFATNVSPSAWRDHLAGRAAGASSPNMWTRRAASFASLRSLRPPRWLRVPGPSEQQRKRSRPGMRSRPCLKPTRSPSGERLTLLSGRNGLPETGPLVCCLLRGRPRRDRKRCCIGRRPASKSSASCLRAGTNCGSCLPELRKIVSRAHTVEHV